MSSDELVISLHRSDAVPAMRDELLEVYADANADLLDQPFNAVERFRERVDQDAAETGFGIAAGRIDGQLIGFAFGLPLSPDAWWWHLGIESLDADTTRETGQRTFSLRELRVRHHCQRRGYGRRLHDAVLLDRPEERVTLNALIDSPARGMYLKWGYHEVCERRAPDAPHMVVMVRVMCLDRP